MPRPTHPATRARRARGLLTVLGAVALVLLIGAGCSGSSGSEGDSAPTLADPEATARDLVTDWLTVLRDEDADAVAASLAPNFQIQRADGTGADRTAYLAKPAVVEEFELGDDLTALQDGDTLTVRWSLRVTETIDGRDYDGVEAPRLTAFVWRDGRWQILAYGNFNPPSAAR